MKGLRLLLRAGSLTEHGAFRAGNDGAEQVYDFALANGETRGNGPNSGLFGILTYFPVRSALRLMM